MMVSWTLEVQPVVEMASSGGLCLGSEGGVDGTCR